MRGRVQDMLKQFDITPRVIEEADATAAVWRSSGDFAADLDLLSRLPSLREDAIADVADQIEQHAADLEKSSVLDALGSIPAIKPALLVMGHSFGQVFSYLALRKLVDEKRINIPFSLLTLGGPLGNPNPIFRSYLKFARKGQLKQADGSLAIWRDLYNPEDGVCSNNLSPHVMMGLLPAMHSNAMSVLVGSLDAFGGHSLDLHVNFENAQSVQFDYPGHALQPLAEHSSYFQSPLLYRAIEEMINQLKDLP